MVGSGLSMGRTMKVIVSGARGCGKTSILEKVIYDNNGVRLGAQGDGIFLHGINN